MSIMEKLFGAAKPQQQTPPQPGVTNNPAQNPAPTGTQQSQQTAPNGVVPEGSEKGPEEKSPADKFATLWESPKTESADPNKAPEELTPEKMLEAAGKLDFKRILNPESLAKIKAGGDDAVGALADLLNQTAQTVYGQSTVVTHKMLEAQEERLKAEFVKQVPDLVRKHAARDSILTENPAFNKPSVAPIVEAIQTQLAIKYPKATASELNVMAKEYLADAATNFAPPQKKSEATPGSQEVDWDQYVEIK